MLNKIKNTTIAQRLWILMIGFILLSIVGYSTAIQETLTIRKQVSEYENSKIRANTYPIKIQSYHKAIHNLDSIFKRDSVQVSIRNKILRFTEKYCDSANIEIINFQETSKDNQDNYTLVYNTICLKGSYSELLTFYHRFESIEGSNKLISLKFYLKKEKYHKTKALYSEGLFQSILYNES